MRYSREAVKKKSPFRFDAFSYGKNSFVHRGIKIGMMLSRLAFLLALGAGMSLASQENMGTVVGIDLGTTYSW